MHSAFDNIDSQFNMQNTNSGRKLPKYQLGQRTSRRVITKKRKKTVNILSFFFITLTSLNIIPPSPPLLIFCESVTRTRESSQPDLFYSQFLFNVLYNESSSWAISLAFTKFKCSKKTLRKTCLCHLKIQ